MTYRSCRKAATQFRWTHSGVVKWRIIFSSTCIAHKVEGVWKFFFWVNTVLLLVRTKDFSSKSNFIVDWGCYPSIFIVMVLRVCDYQIRKLYSSLQNQEFLTRKLRSINNWLKIAYIYRYIKSGEKKGSSLSSAFYDNDANLICSDIMGSKSWDT